MDDQDRHHHEDRYSPDHWGIDKRINISHIIATVILAGSLFAWANNVDNRMSVVEANLSHIEDRIDMDRTRANQDNRRTERSLTEIKAQLVRMEDKLDEKADEE